VINDHRIRYQSILYKHPIGRMVRFCEDRRREIYSAGLFRARAHRQRPGADGSKQKKMGWAAGAAVLQIIMFMPENGDSAHRSFAAPVGGATRGAAGCGSN